MTTRTQNEDAVKLWIAAPAALALLTTPAMAQHDHGAHGAQQTEPVTPPSHDHEAPPAQQHDHVPTADPAPQTNEHDGMQNGAADGHAAMMLR